MAVQSQGSVLYFSTTTALATAISIGSVAGFNGPSGSANVIDITHLGSTAKEKMMGLRDEGQISLDCIFDPANSGQTKLRECRAARTKSHFAIKMTDTAITMIDGDCYVTGFALSGRVDDKLSLSVTLEISGPVLYSTVA
jgi:predicted secreted protein